MEYKKVFKPIKGMFFRETHHENGQSMPYNGIIDYVGDDYFIQKTSLDKGSYNIKQVIRLVPKSDYKYIDPERWQLPKV